MEDKNNNLTLPEYECGHFCRVCPFPGAKCRKNSQKYIAKRKNEEIKQIKR